MNLERDEPNNTRVSNHILMTLDFTLKYNGKPPKDYKQ